MAESRPESASHQLVAVAPVGDGALHAVYYGDGTFVVLNPLAGTVLAAARLPGSFAEAVQILGRELQLHRPGI
jgi:hypothetical protein